MLKVLCLEEKGEIGRLPLYDSGGKKGVSERTAHQSLRFCEASGSRTTRVPNKVPERV